MIWLIMAASFMLVAGLTSIFIITTPNAGEIHVKLPYVFICSTLVILTSSLTLHIANKKIKELNTSKFHFYLWLTIGLGLAFILLQATAWVQLISNKIYFDTSKSYQSFIYVFVLVHFLHIIAGLGLLFYALNGSVRNKARNRILFRTEVSTIFWHFIGLLWIYLYFFLLVK
ncbi:MAG: cytochrome c oxidase subunit 3 [Mucilaginibacter sp.]